MLELDGAMPKPIRPRFAFRQTVLLAQLLPVFPTIVGDEQAARWTTAGKEPRRSAVLPHIRNQLLRVVRIHHEVSRARSVHRCTDSVSNSFRRPNSCTHSSRAIAPSRPGGTHVDLIGVRRIDQNSVNGAGLLPSPSTPSSDLRRSFCTNRNRWFASSEGSPHLSQHK